MSDYLEQFRKQFPSTRVHVEDNYMVYDVAGSFGEDAAREAKELIEKLNLPLEVEVPKASNFATKDTFIVKLKQ
jgi:hypothetical protein